MVKKILIISSVVICLPFCALADPALYEKYQFENTAQYYEIFTGNGRGETFITESAHNVTLVKFYIKKTGDDCLVLAELFAVDGDHKPTGASLGDGSTLVQNTNYDWISFAINEEPELSDVTEYALMLTSECASGNKVLWNLDTGNGYANGINLYYDGTYYVNADYDQPFEVYGDAQATPTPTPTETPSPTGTSTVSALDIVAGFWSGFGEFANEAQWWLYAIIGILFAFLALTLIMRGAKSFFRRL